MKLRKIQFKEVKDNLEKLELAADDRKRFVEDRKARKKLRREEERYNGDRAMSEGKRSI
jgi:hypothetical protein